MKNPIQLIVKDSDNKWQVTEEAESQLNSIDSLIGVVSIIGKFKSGKSYLMNRVCGLDGKQNGFALGNTQMSQTKGIWMFAKPNPKDKRKWLLALDSEGLDDVKTGDEEHDREIFILILLLSHCFMYNSGAAFGNTMIEDLRFISELALKIKVKENGDHEDSVAYFGQHFPHLFVILRNFHQDIRNKDGRQITADQHLEDILSLKKEDTEAAKRFNAPRFCITNFFPDRNCHTLPAPAKDNSNLCRLNELSPDEISDSFTEECDRVIDAVTTVAKTKAEDKGINGPACLYLIKEYVKKINEGESPHIESVYDFAAKKTCERACADAFTLYGEEMDRGPTPTSENELLVLHRRSRQLALQRFKTMAWYGKGEDEGILLQVNISEKLKEYQSASASKCQTALDIHFSQLKRDYSMQKFTSTDCLEKFNGEKEKAIAKYKKEEGLGPMQEDELKKYLKDTIQNIEKCVEMQKESEEYKEATFSQKGLSCAAAPFKAAGSELATMKEWTATALPQLINGSEVDVQICKDYEETVRGLKNENTSQFQKEDKERKRNKQAKKTQGEKYRADGHEDLAEQLEKAIVIIQTDSAKAEQDHHNKQKWYDGILQALESGWEAIKGFCRDVWPIKIANI